MHCRHRTIVTGVHRLQHVQRFRSARFADDDPIGPHTKSIDHQVARCDGTLAFNVRFARLQPHNMRLLQHEFGDVFNRDDTFRFRHKARERIQ